MLNESICLPFRIPSVYGGMGEIRGLLKCRKEGLVLDFEVSLFDAFHLSTQEISIPFEEIAAIEWKQGWFSQWIIVRVMRLQTLQQIPGGKGGELHIKIQRKHALEAEEFVTSLRLALTTRGLKKMLDEEGGPGGTRSP